MCAGLAVMCGPPTVAAACWTLWAAGKDAALRRVGLAECPPMSFFFQGSVGLGSLVAAYQAQKAVLVRHFDEGGVLSLDWKKGATTVSHPRPASRRPPSNEVPSAAQAPSRWESLSRSRLGDSSIAPLGRRCSLGCWRCALRSMLQVVWWCSPTVGEGVGARRRRRGTTLSAEVTRDFGCPVRFGELCRPLDVSRRRGCWSHGTA